MDPLFFVHISALDQLIKIPLAFIDKHMKEENLTCAMLQDHKGGLFPVKMEEDHSFGEGWHEFARDHSLKVGNFLAFRYNGFMVFTVEVCNQTITSVLRDSPIDAQDAVTIDEEGSTQPQNIPSSTGEAPKESIQPQNVPSSTDKDPPLKNQDMYQQADSLFEDGSHETVILDGDTESSHDSEDEDDVSESADESLDPDADNDGDYADESLDKNEDNDSDYADESLHDDDDLVNEDEILEKCHSNATPKSKNVATSSCQGLPILFARVNQLRRRSSANVILVDPVGKKFEGLRFHIYSGRDVRIGRGWSKYSQAQGLRKGDNITVKIVENTMEVVKFQLSHNVPLNGLQSEKKSGKELKHDIVEHRSFRKLLKSPYSLLIPKAFVVRNSLAGHRGNIVLQDGNGGSWNVSLYNDTNRTLMQGGWSKVVEANELKVGDLIRFPLIEARPKPVMRFKVLRSADPKVKGQRSRFSTINNRF